MFGSQAPERFTAESSDNGDVESLKPVVVHAIPGRLRLRVVQLSGRPDRLVRLGRHLGCLDGVQSVDVSPRATSLVLHYKPAAESALLASLQAAYPNLAQPPPTDDAPAEPFQPRTPLNLASKITGLFGRVNSRVERATGGIDLNTLVPLTLLALAVLGLLAGAIRRRKMPAPTWYDLLWFAFNTFIILNLTLSRPINRETSEQSEDVKDPQLEDA